MCLHCVHIVVQVDVAGYITIFQRVCSLLKVCHIHSALCVCIFAEITKVMCEGLARLGTPRE